MPITTQKYKFVQVDLHLHYYIVHEREYIIFVKCLYRVINNDLTIGDQHSDVILRLTFFLASHSKLD